MSDLDGGDATAAIKNPTIIKAAQADVKRLDVLVCGQCHHVFHFVEQFCEHKSNKECGKPAFRTSITEDKPQVWAFLLWKSTVSLSEQESSWALYNRWVKLDNDVRSSWTAAGEAIRLCTAVSVEAETGISKLMKSQTVTSTKSASITSEPDGEAEAGLSASEAESSPSKGNDVENTPEKLKEEKEVVKQGRLVRPRKEEQLPNSGLLDMPSRGRGRPRKFPISVPVVLPTKIKKEPMSDDSSTKEEEKTSPRVIKMTRAASTLLRAKPDLKKKVVVEGTPVQPLPSKATRSKKMSEQKSGDESDDNDYVVEKILAKRLNQKTKEYEYLLKWEGYAHEQNTWEPIHNMVECDKLVENFERSLAKQKANQQAAGHKVITKVIKMPSKPEVKKIEPVAGPSTEIRPVRSSKMRAMENVKSWCMGKRKGDDDSDPDELVPEKKIKIEPESEPMEDESAGSSDENDDKTTPGLLKSLSLIKSSNAPKKPLQSTVAVNGMTKPPDAANKPSTKVAPSQPPVLVANSKGIIKLDSRQVPNLSSGVYIVSNQAGIVQLASPPKLTSPTSSPVKTTVTTPTTPQKPIVSGIVRKIQVQQTQKPPAGTEVRVLGTSDVKLLPKGSPSGLVRIPTPTTIIRKRSPLAPLTGPRPLRVLGPRPMAILQQRPGLKPGQRPPFIPRPPQVLRPPIRPPMPAGPRILMKTPSPAAQVKSGIRPIQAMLGGSLSSPQNIITVSVPKKKPVTPGGITPKVTPQQKKQPITPKGRKIFGKQSPPTVLGINGKQRDSKLIESDSLHMEFQEVESTSSEDDGVESLPELPTGDLPSPPGSPLPLTLCPLTGKILQRAEGEPTPPPSPEPMEILPDMESTSADGEECLKVEMSPGGTTGTVVNIGGQTFDDVALETMHEDGVTVTKLMPSEGGSEGEEEEMEQEYVTITGEDGVVYQMVTQGNNLMEGQVLVGEDGQQVYVTAGSEQQLTLDTAVAEAVSQLIPATDSGDESQDATDDSTQAQVVAQIVEEGDTTPGGMRRVVLLLPDGNFMMTEVDEDQYAALDLDSSDTSPAK